MLLGTVALATLLPPTGAWKPLAGALADAAIVLLFFLNGAKLSRQAIVDGARHWRLHTLTMAVTFVLFPLLGLGIAALHPFGDALTTGMLFLTLLPSTVQSSIAFTAIARGNVAAAVCGAAFSNLLGIVLVPVLVALFIHAGAGAGAGAGGGSGLSWRSVEPILLQLLLPFVLGHLLRPVVGGFVARHKPLTAVVDRGSILLVVYTAFGAAVVEGLWQRVSAGDLALVAGLSVVLLAIVMVASWTLGRLAGFAREDRIVLLFCGSKKSLASGVPMAGVLFPAAGVGTVILPLMVFHQLQLIACAILARRLAETAPR